MCSHNNFWKRIASGEKPYEVIIATMKAAVEAKGCKVAHISQTKVFTHMVDEAICEGIEFDKDFNVAEMEME